MASPLIQISTSVGDPNFQALLAWPFSTTTFYENQVKVLLAKEIPHRVKLNSCLIWCYKDQVGNMVGFGTLDICDDYSRYTNGKRHAYIPLLAVNPILKGKGYGTSIVRNLIEQSNLSVTVRQRYPT